MLILGHRANHAASFRMEKLCYVAELHSGMAKLVFSDKEGPLPGESHSQPCCVAISRADSLPSLCHLILRAGFMTWCHRLFLLCRSSPWEEDNLVTTVHEASTGWRPWVATGHNKLFKLTRHYSYYVT